ncbi:hypothetical protein DFH28DRAFT_473543 [Melampsora americana]|nr:hypothetical protein DFH28DRAFT_473543 [Melampsora americana]
MLSSLFVAVGLCISGLAAKSVEYNTHVTRATHHDHDLKVLVSRALAANMSTAPICQPPPSGDPKFEPQLTLSAGIRSADCLSALSGFLKKKNGNWIVQINPTNVKSCGTCKVRLNTTDSGPLWIPLPIVQYGMGDKLDGGLVKLLATCPAHAGTIVIAGGSATGGGIVVTVSKGSGKSNCGPLESSHNDELHMGPGPKKVDNTTTTPSTTAPPPKKSAINSTSTP